MSEHQSPMAEPCPPTGFAAVLAWLERAGDRLNPILVKETRQALKSRQFTVWFLLILIACWVTTIGGAALIGPSIYYISSGTYFLYAYYFILALPLVVVIPYSAYRSLASEQEENTRDLLEVSALSSRQIINGKLGSAALQMTLYLSALAPCIAFTYLLRGVDATSIALVLAYAVLACIGLSATGLLFAATTRQRQGQVLLSVLLVGGLFACFSALLSAASAVLLVDWREAEFWWGHFGVLCLYLTTLLIVYEGAAALTTFSSANRSTSLRVAVVIQQTVFLAWVAGLAVTLSVNKQFIVFALFISSVYWFAVGAIASGESPTMSERVRRRLPKSTLARVCLTWFNPGPGSGYVFAVSNLGVVTLLYLAGMAFIARNQGASVLEECLIAALLWAYVAGYLCLGWLAIAGLRWLAPITLVGAFLVQLLIALAGSVTPFMVIAISDRIRVVNHLVLQIPSPVWTINAIMTGALNATQQTTVAVGVFACAAALLLVGLSMAGREARLAPLARPKRVIEDDLQQSPQAEATPVNPWGDLPRAEEV